MKTAMGLMGCALALTVGAGCIPGKPATPGNARAVQLYNCTHVNGPTEPPRGRAFNIFTRVDGGAWVPRGGSNPQPGPWTDCHDAAHEGSSITVETFDPPGNWEFRAILLPRSEEAQCDSSAPDVPNACLFITSFFKTDLSAGTVRLDLSDE